MSDLRLFPLMALAAVLLAGCGSSSTAVKPCCYQGAVVVARLEALPVTLADGSTVAFTEVFEGFMPQEALITRPLPFNEVQRRDIIYASLEPLLPIYDANDDGQLEKPEVVVLYAREAARALGTDVRHFGAGTPAWAVATSNADIGGLVAWVEARRAQMSAPGQTVFRDLDQLGRDLRTRGSEGGRDGDRAVISR